VLVVSSLSLSLSLLSSKLKIGQVHMNAKANASKIDVALEYMDSLKNRLALPLVLRGEEGIDEVIATMESYGLMREDWDTVMELTTWHDPNDPNVILACFVLGCSWLNACRKSTFQSKSSRESSLPSRASTIRSTTPSS
jgi:hypothetical protein